MSSMGLFISTGSSENHVVYLAGDPAHFQAPPFICFRTCELAELFWPRGGPVASASAGVRSRETQNSSLRSAMSGEDVPHRAESSEARAAAVSDIQDLMRRKEEIEAEIKANYDVLESVSVAGRPADEARGRCQAVSWGGVFAACHTPL